MNNIKPFVFLLLMLSCDNPQPEKAKINIKQLADVVMELRLANAGFNLYYNQMQEKDKHWEPYQAEIFQRLKLNPADVTSSLKIHAQSPDSILLMDSLILVKLEAKSRKEIQPGIDAHHPIKKYQRQIHRQGR